MAKIVGNTTATPIVVDDKTLTNVTEQGLINITSREFDGTNRIATTRYVEEKLGDVESVLDNIIAIQNTLIGGDSV